MKNRKRHMLPHCVVFRGKNWRNEATVFGWLAGIFTADWSPGDSRCHGPSARLSFPHAPPLPSQPCSSSLCQSVSLLHFFLSSHLCQLICHLPPSTLIQLLSLFFFHSVVVIVILFISLFTPSVVTVGSSAALFYPPALPFVPPQMGTNCPFHTTYLLCKSC